MHKCNSAIKSKQNFSNNFGKQQSDFIKKQVRLCVLIIIHLPIYNFGVNKGHRKMCGAMNNKNQQLSIISQ